MTSRKVRDAIRAFEKAVTDKAFEGTIPYTSDDPEEQEALENTHLAIEHNYVKARAKLERLMENV